MYKKGERTKSWRTGRNRGRKKTKVNGRKTGRKMRVRKEGK